MKKTSFLCGLVLLFSLLERAVQDETAAEGAVSPGNNTVAPAPAEDAKSGTASKNKDASSAPEAGSTKCKPNEMLSDTGCIDRDFFLNRMMMQSWSDGSFDKAKMGVVVVEPKKCKKDEVKTLHGCSKVSVLEDSMAKRVPMVGSHLINDNAIVHTSDLVKRNHNEIDGADEDEQPKKFKKSHTGPALTGEDRPRFYVFLPGRSLRKGKRCRPYEVQGTKRRCIRRKRPWPRMTPREKQIN